MQTFLPYADFARSAAVLDQMRLGKQRVETLQILQKLLNERLITGEKVDSGRVRRISLSPEGTAEEDIEWREEPIMVKQYWPRDKWRREPILTKGWGSHPAKVMWEGHELSLLAYQEAVCSEWTSRGYADTCLEKSYVLLEPHLDRLKHTAEPPPWLGWDLFHASHRSNLLRKDPYHYSAYWPDADSEIPYVWPSTDWPPA